MNAMYASLLQVFWCLEDYCMSTITRFFRLHTRLALGTLDTQPSLFEGMT